MTIKWTENLVRECRNREYVPFEKMTAMARLAIITLRNEARLGGPCRVEYYGQAGWHPALDGGFTCMHNLAYRIVPGWHPLEKKGGRS